MGEVFVICTMLWTCLCWKCSGIDKHVTIFSECKYMKRTYLYIKSNMNKYNTWSNSNKHFSIVTTTYQYTGILTTQYFPCYQSQHATRRQKQLLSFDNHRKLSKNIAGVYRRAKVLQRWRLAFSCYANLYGKHV